MVNLICQGSPIAIKSTTTLFESSERNDLETQLNSELTHVKKTSATEDFQEDLSSFLELRAPKFKGE